MSVTTPDSPHFAKPAHWTLDHVGIAVADLQASVDLYCATLGFSIEEREHVAEHRVDVVFLSSGPASVELIQPLEGNVALARFLERRGPGLHHVCFAVSDLVAELSTLKTRGVRFIDEAPRPGSRDCLVAFLHPSSCGGTLIELCQYRSPAQGGTAARS